MKGPLQYSLKPLRIPGGWGMAINLLFELEMTPDTVEWFGGSVLISGFHMPSGRCFDCALVPEDDPTGEFVLNFMTLNNAHDRRQVKEEFLGSFSTRDSAQLIARIEAFMLETARQSDQQDSWLDQYSPHPIRLPSGWTLSHNRLPEAPFKTPTADASSDEPLIAGMGHEHGFSARYETGHDGIDRFVLAFERFKRNRQQEPYNRTPLGEFRTRNPQRLVERIEYFALGYWTHAHELLEPHA